MELPALWIRKQTNTMTSIILRGVIASRSRSKDAVTIKTFSIRVSSQTFPMIRVKLEYEYDYLVNVLKYYKSKGIIKSIFKPKNKKIQSKLDEIVAAKRVINESLRAIKITFYNYDTSNHKPGSNPFTYYTQRKFF